MLNIEIKAKFPNLERGIALAKSLGATDEGVLHQIDTYFNVAQGRLKLREINAERAELIHYSRPNEDGPKSSHYEITPIPDPEIFKAILEGAIGVWKVVEKRRRLFILEEVRIHLDEVVNLGRFLEFEGVVQDEKTKNSTQAKVQSLVDAFGIHPDDLIAGSYSDMR